MCEQEQFGARSLPKKAAKRSLSRTTMGFDRSICAVGSRGLQLCINHLLEPTSPSSSLASLGATRRLEEGGTNATPPPPTAGPAPNIYTRTRTPSTSYLGALTLGGRGGLSQTRSLLSLDLGAYRQTGNLKMPRSFLIKKHFSTSKKPNYGELDSQTGKSPGWWAQRAGVAL